MSKVAKSIKMLDILSSGNRYSCTTLAKMLEVSPRMVRSYKEELEKEGFYIESFLGKDGGYQLKQSIDMPEILFSEEDIKILNNIIKKDTSYKVELGDLKNKIERYCHLVNEDITFLDENKQNILKDIKTAIANKESIKIEYYSKGELKVRSIRPKQIFLYDKLVMIVVQYSEEVNDIRHINLDRIEKIIK